MTWAWISAGSNMQPEKNLRAAVVQLREQFGRLRLSPVYQTVAEGFDGDDFLNAVIGIETNKTQQEVRQLLRHIEDRQGRVRQAQKFSSRTLDLDLLTWGAEVDRKKGIPRDEILEYAFVLKPLADVAGDELHPELGISYGRLWQQFAGRRSGLKPLAIEL